MGFKIHRPNLLLMLTPSQSNMKAETLALKPKMKKNDFPTHKLNYVPTEVASMVKIPRSDNSYQKGNQWRWQSRMQIVYMN